MDKEPSSKWYDGIQDGDLDPMLKLISQPNWKDVSICLEDKPLETVESMLSERGKMLSPGMSQEFSNSRLNYKVSLNGKMFKKGKAFKKANTLKKSVAFKKVSQRLSQSIAPRQISSEIRGAKPKSLTKSKSALGQNIDLLVMLEKSPPGEANTEQGFLQQKYGQGLQQSIAYQGSGLSRQGTMNKLPDFN